MEIYYYINFEYINLQHIYMFVIQNKIHMYIWSPTREVAAIQGATAKALLVLQLASRKASLQVAS